MGEKQPNTSPDNELDRIRRLEEAAKPKGLASLDEWDRQAEAQRKL